MNVRVLTITDTAAAEREMASIGCDPYGISVMAPKAVMRTVLLEGVDNRAANLVKQEMLALGGDAAVNRDVSCFKKGVSRVLVMASLTLTGSGAPRRNVHPS
jgi:dihydropteroate synthase